MAGPVVSRSPACLWCMRRLAQPFLSPNGPVNSLPLVQTRAKSTHLVPSDKGVVVRLLANIPKFGRKDAIFRVERGRMRNEWFPRKLAEYMTVARFKELGLSPKNDVGERDPTFVDMKVLEQLPAAKPPAPVAEPQQAAKPVKKTIKPERVRELLERLVPKTITFYRIPIPAPPSNTATISPLVAVAAAQETPQGPLAIYGSVSTKDIASSIKSCISADEDGAQINIEPAHVTVLGLKDEINKIKELGRFEVKVSIGNSDLEPITRSVEVLPSEEKTQEPQPASKKTAV
ncbi:uncharacterized protein PODANS_1_14200 [Podospora anserina S mat+]|uniref:Podospora anserina S mat+ genomic DNA chromosome 1, supercontig 3 n=1 Tax=Podospora anserina (strain S / ATCC MYA-4624 / DSM 980 / FGSC 10383) TaxID=515849 RepID=B2AM43_PODAN|nr:uncharacterized protein PODANS_1_14200 [Podospora anserina S mat+]CAP65031.1 unnamed protein product [Podospora anserina S mat+]CDP23653.1 Putative protein of unknown function [Podospora anserina S mat+]